MEDPSLVRINLDPPERIADLYDIGFKVAERIVAHRESSGPFSGPEDLARVEGISPKLAITLSPHIDWSIPQEPEQPFRRQWGCAISLIILVALLGWLTRPELPGSMQAVWEEFAAIEPLGLRLLAAVLFPAIIILLLVAVSTLLISLLVRTPARSRKLLRVTVGSMGAALAAFILAEILLRILPPFLSDADPGTGLALRFYVMTLGVSVVLLMVFLPLLLVVWRPSLLRHSWLPRIYDLGIVVMGFFISLAYLVTEDQPSLLAQLIISVMASAGIVIGISFIRSGRSLFPGMLNSLIQVGAQVPEKDWPTWINAHIPDPEDQKAVLAVLYRRYPPSRWQTVIGAVIIGAGGWLVVQSLSAIIQWLVGRGLDSLFP